jgi:hypothetical protein
MVGSGTGASVQRERRDVAVRCGILVALVVAYWDFLDTLHGRIGSAAFLVGLGICLLAAAWLGVRGALVALLGVALIDRGFALGLPASASTGATAGIVALLVKLVLAGGLGLAVDSRRRALALRAEQPQRATSERVRSR